MPLAGVQDVCHEDLKQRSALVQVHKLQPATESWLMIRCRRGPRARRDHAERLCGDSRDSS
jgi:hypothetical protein